LNCASCQAEIPTAAKFCPECGAKVDVSGRCSSCGEPFKPTAKFCHSCGAPVAGEKPAKVTMAATPRVTTPPKPSRAVTIAAFLAIPAFAILIIVLLFWKNRDPQPLPASDTISAPMPEAAANNSKDELIYTLPQSWKPQLTTASTFRMAQAEIPGSGGPGELAVFFFGAGGGGDVEANLARWVNQVEATSAPRHENFEIDGLRVTWVEVGGTIKPSSMGMGATTAQPNSRMFGAVIEGYGGPWFFKATGPDQTMNDERENFVAMLKNMRHKSLESYKTNLEKNSGDLASIDSVAKIYAIVGNYDKASKYYRHHLELKPHDNIVKSNLAWAYFMQDNSSEAMTLIQDVLKTEPTHPLALYILGHIYRSQGKKEEARQHLQIIVDKYSGTEWANRAQQLIHELTHVENTSNN